MAKTPGPGLIELPGMKGEIRITYDLTKGAMNVETNSLAFPQLAQLLTAALGETLRQWAEADAGIIRPKGTSDDGSEKGSDAKDDDNNG